MEQFWSALVFSPVGIMEAQGHSGGIWILSAKTGFRATVVDSFHQCLSIEISCGTRKWVCTAVYAHPTPTIRSGLWEHLKNLRRTIDKSWLMLSDFTEVLLPSEVIGGIFSHARAVVFAEMIDERHLIDLGANGERFTWFRSNQGARRLAKRLGRALGDVSWRNQFPEAFVTNLP